MLSSKLICQVAIRSCRWLVIAILALHLGAAARAQSTAALSGTVTDPTGAAVPNATVVARNVATGVETSLTTDSSGAYLFPGLPIGSYRVEVTATGFNKAVLTSLTLQVATSVTRD